ncbi:tetratricopeptide repeat protein [Sphingopyxis sp. H115]|uniref:tetratricopeptide repeat protein n=1 Tax=Sphingopyxis sp. H115 TaxID=1759073 RepID=UPI000AC5630A|nr:tetratricopeptide repeat protein [Sphingopyxis sp. H115]
MEARFRSEIDQEDKALRALEQAHSSGARGSGTPIRIARMHEARGRRDDASKILREALARSPDDKPLHSAMAHHLMKLEQPDFDTVADHLRRSFTMGDRAFEQRFDLAQLLFLRGAIEDCRNLFADIDERAPDEFRKMTPRSDNVFTALLPSYRGTITSLKPSYAFIRSAAYISDIFGHRSMSDVDSFDDLSIGEEVTFRLRFNRSRPTAVDIQPGR